MAWLEDMLAALSAGNPTRQDLAQMREGVTVPTGDQLGQVAQGAAAGALGAPVEIANMALQPFGLGSEQPVAGEEWWGEKFGADVDSPEFVGGTFVSPDPLGKVASLASLGGLAFSRAAKRGIDKGDDLANELDRISAQRKVQDDYEKDVTFVEMDTVDPSVDARIKTTGQYRGAPRGTTSPQRLGKMRRNLWQLLDEGSLGRDWYEQSARSASELTGERPNYKHLLAGANAVTSRGAAVPANRVFGVRGYNQAITGRPVDAGRFPTSQGAAIEQLARGETYYGGPKETPFYEGLTIDERAEGIRPTNDLWMARAFGYTRPDGSEWGEGLGKAQHRFMDNEINHLVKKANEAELGGFDDWTAEKVQAAVWVAQKAKHEGTTVAKAAEDFSHGLEDLTGNIRFEAYPSTSLEHMEGMGQSDEYADVVQAMLEDDMGRNRLAMSTGALTRPGDRGYGIYEGATSPSMSARVMVAPETGSSMVEPASQSLMRGTGAAHGMLLGQDTVGVTTFRPAKKASERNIARVNIGEVTPEVMEDLEKALAGTDSFPLHTPNGIEVAYMGDDGAKFTKDMKKVFGKDIEFGRNTGDLIGNTDWGDPGYKPSAWMREIDEAELGPAAGRLESEMMGMADTLDQMDTALEEFIPDAGSRDEILTRTRQILSAEGFAGIRKAVEAGILPVVVLTTLGLNAPMGANEEGLQ